MTRAATLRAPAWGLPLAVGAATATLVVALVLAGGAPQAVEAGLPDAGAFTGWALPVARWWFDVAAVGTVGMLLTGAVVLPAVDGRLSSAGTRSVRAATWWAAAWSLAALFSAVLAASDIAGEPIHRVLSGAPAGGLWGLPQVRGMVVVAALSAGAALLARRVRGIAACRGVLTVALAGLLPPVLAGHSAAAANHDLASSSLFVHVVAASLWVGGLLGLVLNARHAGSELPAAVQRYSLVALGCLVAVAASGVLNAWLRLRGSLLAWESGYVLLLVTKVLALMLLGAFGWHHRRRTICALVAHRPLAFLRWAAVELAAMGVAVALAVALARTPTPSVAGEPVAPSHGSGHPVLGTTVEPFTAARLLTEWRPDAVVLSVVALGLVAYVSGVRRLAARGGRWPAHRVVAALVAAAVTVLALCGGMAEYSVALLSVHVAQLMTLLLVVPALLALSAPVTLEQQLRSQPLNLAVGPSARLVRRLCDPVNGLTLVITLLVAVYATPVLELSLRHVTVHLAVQGLTLMVGSVLMWSLVGVDPVLGARHSGRDRVVLALLLAGVLVGFGVLIAVRRDLLAAAWFTELRWSWADPQVDQRRAAAVAWVFAQVVVPLLLAAAYVQSSRSQSSRSQSSALQRVSRRTR